MTYNSHVFFCFFLHRHRCISIDPTNMLAWCAAILEMKTRANTYTKLLGVVEDIVVDQQVVAEVVEVGGHVAEESSDLGSQVDDMGRSILLEDGLGLSGVAIICINRERQ